MVLSASLFAPAAAARVHAWRLKHVNAILAGRVMHAKHAISALRPHVIRTVARPPAAMVAAAVMAVARLWALQLAWRWWCWWLLLWPCSGLPASDGTALAFHRRRNASQPRYVGPTRTTVWQRIAQRSAMVWIAEEEGVEREWKLKDLHVDPDFLFLHPKADERFDQQFAVLLGGAEACRAAYKALDIDLKELELRTTEVLGAGNYGVVMTGVFKGSKRHPAWRHLRGGEAVVAVKTIRVVDDATTKQFLLEMRLLAAVSHPNIVALLAVQELQLPLLLVMQYCPGGDLRTCLKAGQGLLRAMGMSLPLAEAYVDMACQIASALEYLHSKLCVHRDIAARNILVVKVDNASENVRYARCGLLMKLSDLGLARVLRSEQDYYKVRGEANVSCPLQIACA